LFIRILPMAMYGKSVTIVNGQQNSPDVQLDSGLSLVGIYVPAGFEGTSLSFLIEHPTETGGLTLYHDGADVAIVVAASKYVALDPFLFAGVNKFKIRSNNAVGADRTLVLAARPV
jgi:hypothetical protein